MERFKRTGVVLSLACLLVFSGCTKQTDEQILVDDTVVTSIEETTEESSDVSEQEAPQETEEIAPEESIEKTEATGNEQKKVEAEQIEAGETQEAVTTEQAEQIAEAAQQTTVDVPQEETWTVTDMNVTKYATTDLNIRSGPSTAHSVVGSLSFAQAVQVTGQVDRSSWVRVDYNGEARYCSGKFLSESEPQKIVNSTASTGSDTGAVSISGICESKAGASGAWVSKVNAQLSSVPSNILTSFVNNGWHIYATGENIASVYFGGAYKSVRGATMWDSKSIVIECRDAAMTAPCHEMGHYLDYMCGNPSLGSEFAGIYNEEVATFKSQISNPGCVSSAQEFFAETFYYVCKNPSKCTPKAAEFVRRYMGTI